MAALGAGSGAVTLTLLGRWQTRFFLLAVLGLPVTLFFSALYGDWRTPPALLGYVLLLGFGWDVVYYFLQCLRWDHDWPPAFAFVAGGVEGATLWGLMQADFWGRPLGLDGLPGVAAEVALWQFAAHYGTVWLLTFVASLGLVQIFFPRWRFRGGQWW